MPQVIFRVVQLQNSAVVGVQGFVYDFSGRWQHPRHFPIDEVLDQGHGVGERTQFRALLDTIRPPGDSLRAQILPA